MTDEKQWAVISGSYPNFKVVGPIIKQTAQRIYFPHSWGRVGEGFADLGAVKYRGDEATCRSMAEQMISSEALMNQERQRAVARHYERVAKIANSAKSDAQVSEPACDEGNPATDSGGKP